LEQFSYVKRGYSPEEVNKYIATLEQVIKSYKEKDNAIKNAIISAQVAADNVVRNAHMQAHEYKKKISQQLVQVSAAIDAERMRLQAFHDVYSGLMRKYLYEIETADMFEMSRRLDDMEKLISDLLEMDVPPITEPTPLLPSLEPEAKAGPAAEGDIQMDFPHYPPEPEYGAEPVQEYNPEYSQENIQDFESPPVAPPPRSV
jgi:hypothetical protein